MSEPLSAERLAEIRARADAATQGPWHFAYTSIWGDGRVAREEAWLDSLDAAHTLDRNPCEHCDGGPCAYRGKALDMDPVVARVQPSYGDTATGQRVLDAEFIAAARQDIPDLLAEIDRLRAWQALSRLQALAAEPGPSRWFSAAHDEPGERLPSHDDADHGHDATPADERGRASAFRQSSGTDPAWDGTGE